RNCHAFREATAGVAATAHPSERETNLVMTTNYEKLTTALTSQVKNNMPRSRPTYSNNSNSISSWFTCTNCREVGHMAWKYVNFVGLKEYEEYTPEVEAKVFVIPEARYQPYPSQRTRSRIKNSESQIEERLRNNSSAADILLANPVNRGPDLITLILGNFIPLRSLRKKGPSEIDKLEPYNMTHDLLNQKANITYSQMLKYTNQRKNLALALKRPFLTEKILTPPLEMMKANIIQLKERQLAKIPISHDGEPLLLNFNDRDESEGMFNKFEYEDEDLKEAERYFIEEILSDELYKNPWRDYLSPTVYLANIEELLTDKKDPDEEILEEKIERNINIKDLTSEQQEKAHTQLI
ncbi:10975_t:CDS:2, partial [Cetraspora pellucida]